ncbi:Cache 3/Cache 2 fusion domain-containing protein [Neiella marina]|uniref:Cache 3/Cache 2 fusion domain-containing protein n=1 Tax=Neiella holothuriorum TaxID=2870530 RepID=A0ABS7EJJ2_9GAMM|nr:Cache 3/Cache 2 fusion domain-containing protein [Neiella holothuriorum]MBW8192516.1 Cache 3/Cache 2 fusion domain-containing protein [Neiella holothuriorum]
MKRSMGSMIPLPIGRFFYCGSVMVQQILQLTSLQQLKLGLLALIMLCTVATAGMTFHQFHLSSNSSDNGKACPVPGQGSAEHALAYATTLDTVREQLTGWREHELVNLSPSQRRELVDGVEVNQLLINGVPVSANIEMVDRFLEATGSHATVFVREGSDFVRVATTLNKGDGTRAIGSFLGESHAGYQQLLEGHEFSNRVTLFGQSYIACYFPLLKNGEVYAVLFAGIPLQSIVQDIFSPLEDMGLGQGVKKTDIIRLM